MLGTNDYKITNAREESDLRYSMNELLKCVRRVYQKRIILLSPIYLKKALRI